MLPEPSNLPRKVVSTKPKLPPNVRVNPNLQAQQSARPVYATNNPAQREVAQPNNRTANQRQQTQMQRYGVRRPGCVTITAVFLFIWAGFALLGTTASLILLDGIALLNNFSQAFLLTVMALGLWLMYRWAVNLFLIFCVANILQLLTFPVLSAFIIDDYIKNDATQTVYIIMLFGFFGVGSFIIGLVMWWYFKTRRFFVPNDIFPKWEQTLYIFAVGILAMVVLITASNLPEAYEAQREQLKILDEQSTSIEATPIAPQSPKNKTPFG